MRVRHRGFTLIEVLAALAVAALLAVGVSQLVLAAMEDNKGQQAGQHQQRVAAAASRYLAANHAALAATATATAPATVSVAQLQAAGFLPASLSATNPYGQSHCLLVLQPSPGQLEALLVTEGSPKIPEKELSYVAAHSGSGGGFIGYGTPLVAQGAFNAWRLDTAQTASFLSANCSGTPASAGHLASALFYESADTADYLYRGSVPGHPELNRMTTPLHMAAVAVEGDTADTRCMAADTNTHGRIAVDAAGRVLSCQAGEWKRQGSATWRDPVAGFADLPTADNQLGDVRMVTALNRAFTWNGSAWLALSVDENGNLTVPGTATAGMVQLNTEVTRNDSCASPGLLAREASGSLLVCSSGSWRSLREDRITGTAYYQRYLFRPADGVQNFTVDVSSMPGSRPLYVTGYSYCNSTSSVRAWTVVEPFDADGNRLGYSGGCGARSTDMQGRVMTKGVLPLAKLPANTATLRVYMEPGGRAEDYAQLDLYVMNAE